MKILIIIAHPLKNSLNNFLAEKIINKLTQQGHEIIIENLYANSFDPRLRADERKSYYEIYEISFIKEQAKQLLLADALILIFPTWWFGFPAILKGWFDRVWGPEIAFEHSDNFGPIKPKLNGLKKIMAITTLGSPYWVDRFIMRQPVKKILKIALLKTCAPKSKLEFFSLYDCEKLSENKIDRFSRKITNALDRWR